MADEWVAIKQLDDLADAEWEANALREADIPARVDETGGGLSILVESENADAARERLQSLEGEDEDDPPAPVETAEDKPTVSRLVTNSPERDRHFQIAYGRAFIGIFFPPWLVSAIIHLWKGYHEPEPIAAQDIHQLLFSGLLILAGLVFWITVAANVIS